MEDKIIYQDKEQIVSLSGEFLDFMDTYYVQKVILSKRNFNFLLKLVLRNAEQNGVILKDIQVKVSSKAIKFKPYQAVCLTEQFLPLTEAFDLLTSIEDYSIIDKNEIVHEIEELYTEDDTNVGCFIFPTPLFQVDGYVWCQYEDKLLVVFFAFPDNTGNKG